MAELNINTPATINHVNARKEGPDNEKILALDVKCTGIVDHNVIAAVIGTETPEEAYTAFWLEDEDKTPRFWNIEHVKIPSGTDFKDCNATFGRTECKGVSVRKFQFSPASGGLAYLTFTVSITDPAVGLMPLLAEQLGEEINVVARSAQQELPLGQGEEAA